MKKIIFLAVINLYLVNFSFSQLSYGTKIGQTYYDLSSNGSVGNRLIQNSDGTISATWISHWDILTTDNQPKSNVRGFGYNHYDPSGGGWVYGTDGECWLNAYGCASSYVGWPEIINNPGGTGNDEIIYNHTPLKRTTRPSIGTGSWSATTNMNIEVDMGQGSWTGTWPRAVSSGNYVHLITTSTDQGGFFDLTGVEMPVVYFRSTDGGGTWSSPASFNMTTSDLNYIGSDAYAIHANGSNVAVTFGGGIDNDWLLFKSTNNGTSWSKTVIKSNHNLDTAIVDGTGGWGAITNADEFEIIIDDNGVAHVFAAMGFESNNGGTYLVRASDYKNGGNGWNTSLGMLYWNENMGSSAPIVVAYPDYGSDGNSSDYSANTSEFYGHIYLGYPTASFDASGNIYLLYSAIAEDAGSDFITTAGDTLGYNDVYMVFSLDNGTTWCRTNNPINIADDVAGISGGTATEDDLFPNSVPRVINDKLEYMWQGDYSRPGLALYDDTHPNDQLNYIEHYSLDVSGLSSCSSVPTAITAPSLTVSSLTSPSCYGMSDGQIVVSASGGSGSGYTYSTDGTTYVSSNVFGGLPAGSYTFYVQDGTGMVGTLNYSLGQPTAVSLGSSSITNSNCGSSDGSFTVAGSGGSGSGYTYSTDGSTYQSSGTFTNLSSGGYNVYIKDGNGCIGTTTINVNDANAPTMTVSATNPLCNGGTGSVTLNATGGSGGNQYSIDGTSFQSSNVFTGLTSGSYVATVEDNAGCSSTASFTLTSPNALIFLSVNSTNSTCGATDGSIIASASGGTGTILYSVDGTSFQAASTFSNLAAGTYTVTAKDANNCTTTFNIVVSNQGAPTFSLSGSNTVCTGVTTNITISASGGQSPYIYSTDGVNFGAANIVTLGAGTYTFYVKDNLGCVSDVATYTITASPCTGIADDVIFNVTVYPNPSNGVFNLELSSTVLKEVKVSVINLFGKEVMSSILRVDEETSTQIDLSEYATGVYFLNLVDNNGNNQMIKLINE